MWIVSENSRRDVDEHSIGNLETDDLRDRTDDDFGDKAGRSLRRAAKLGVKHSAIGFDEHGPRTSVTVGPKHPPSAIRLHLPASAAGLASTALGQDQHVGLVVGLIGASAGIPGRNLRLA